MRELPVLSFPNLSFFQAVYTAESVAAYFVVAYWKGLANNGMTDEERTTLDPSSEEWRLRVDGSKTHVIGLLLYATLLWLLKGCWTAYYYRLTYVEEDTLLCHLHETDYTMTEMA